MTCDRGNYFLVCNSKNFNDLADFCRFLAGFQLRIQTNFLGRAATVVVRCTQSSPPSSPPRIQRSLDKVRRLHAVLRL